jgi:hypothetical protein
MRVNKEIRNTLIAIADESIKYANAPDAKKTHIKRLLRVFNKCLNEEEQVFIIAFMLENIHLTSVITDPDNMLAIQNVKLRNYFFKFLSVLILIIVAGMIFTGEVSIDSVTSFFANFFKLLTL